MSNLSMTRHHLILLVLLYAAAFRLVAMNRPFQYDDEATGCFYGVLARNYLRFGLTRTHGIPVETISEPPDGSLFYYPDHPPLVPLLIAPMYLLFGVGEWQTRLPTSVATVAAGYVLYRLLRRRATEPAALIAAALFVAMPMNLYFGGLPEVVGMPLVLFVLMAVSAYLALHEQPNARRLLRLIGAFTLAGLSDWPAFIIVPVFGVHWLTTRPRRQWPWIVVFGAVACALFAALAGYIAWATDAPWNWMVPLFRRRAAIGTSAPFTARQWLITALTFNRHLHTMPILVASALWLLTSAFDLRRREPGATAARILLAWGMLHVLIGRQGVFNHEWWWSPLTPGLAVATALLVDRIRTAAERLRFPQVACAMAVLLVVVFAAWTSTTSWRQLFPPREASLTPMDFGQAIRAAAPQPGDVALLVWSGSDPSLWFYGDRPLRANVWSIADLERRVNDQTVDVMFDEVQPWKAPATGLVFPVMYRRDLHELRTYLQRTYALVPPASGLAGKFEVFDLRRPLTAMP